MVSVTPLLSRPQLKGARRRLLKPLPPRVTVNMSKPSSPPFSSRVHSPTPSEKRGADVQCTDEPASEKRIGLSTQAEGGSDQLGDPHLVDYDGPADPASPKNWSATYKWSLVAILSGMSLTT